MPESPQQERILIIAPMGQDAAAMAAILGLHGCAVAICADPGECLKEIEAGAGTLLLTEEALELPRAAELLSSLRLHPAWSELPLIILTSGGETRVNSVLELASSAAGSIMLLERPMGQSTLLRSIEVALSARRRQYQVRDLLAKQQSQQQELRESEERFRVMADGLPLIIWVHDAEGKQQFVNSTWCSFFGIVPEAMKGDEWLCLMHPEDVERYASEFARCTGERRPFAAEARVRRADGEWRWIQSWGQPRLSSAGDFLGVVGASADVTERKRAEADLARQAFELAELNRNLDQRVQQRTAQLRELNRQLAQTEHRERSQLAQVLHDGLQQFLVAARMHAELVAAAENRESREERCARLCGLLNEAIAASRSLTLELSPPALQEEGLASALNWLAKWVNEKHHFQLEVNMAAAVEIDDPTQRLVLFQCARELILNAIKHSGTRQARVTLSHEAEQREVCLEVRDQGKGFDVGILGGPIESLGFRTIRQRLDLIGGKLEMEAARGRGTRVVLRVPIVAVPKPAPAGVRPDMTRQIPNAMLTAKPTWSAGKRVRLLLADDHQIVREGLAEILRKQRDFELVGEADDGLRALELAVQLKPDVVLMDVHMPRLNGMEATRRILAAVPEVQVIALSTNDEVVDGNAMRRAGSVAYLTKDEPVGRLLSTIRKVVGAEVTAAALP